MSLLLMPFVHFGQDGDMHPISLQERISESDLIIEGAVLSKNSYWDAKHQLIYTIHDVEVYKILKGDTNKSSIQVAIKGGVVDGVMLSVSNTVKIREGDNGVFVLKNFGKSLASGGPTQLYEIVAAAQGFIRYSALGEKATDIFNTYESIEKNLFPAIASKVKKPVLDIRKNPLFEKVRLSAKGAGSLKSIMPPPTISSFTPMTISAGIDELLTINGSNFGTSGTVGFADADDGGASVFIADASEIVSWTNTQIVLKVPSRASTGDITVTNDSGDAIESSQSLTVPFARLNINNLKTTIVNQSGDAGIPYQYSPNFQGSQGAPYFENAIDVWSCYSGVNFTVGANTNISDVQNDGISIVRYAALPTGTNGQAASWAYRTCGDIWYVGEIDITFSDTVSWIYDDGDPGSIDFKSVALHELGHAHQLGHVNKVFDVMHFGIFPGAVTFTLSAENQMGADNAMLDFVATPVCGGTAMTPLNTAITIEPEPYATCLNTNALFNVEISGNASYQWQVNDGGGWLNLVENASTTGTTTASLSDLITLPAKDGDLYRCEITTGCGPILYTDEVALTLTASPNSMVTENNATCGNSDGKLNVTLPVVGGQSTYEFSTDGGMTYPNVFNADGGTAEILNLAANTYSVWVRWGNGACAVDLGNFIIDSDTAVITTQPVLQDICAGERADFNVVAPGANAWQWQMNTTGTWINITAASANTANLSFQPTADATIRCELTDSCGTTYYTDVVPLTINIAPTATIGKTDTSCGMDNGTLSFTFTDIAGKTGYEFSIDNGVNYAYAYPDTDGMATITNLEADTYEVWVRWNDQECPVALGSYVIAESDSPTATVTVTPIQCDVPTGALTLTFTDFNTQNTIEFSIDGGVNFDYSYADTVGSAEISGLIAGDYQVVSRWPDGSCQTNLGEYTVAVSTELPNLMTQNLTVQLDAQGEASIVATDLDNGSTSNCGFTTISADKTTFDCTDLGANTITLSFTETGGKVTTTTTMVTVEDAIAPELVTKDVVLPLDANNNATLTAADITESSSDNCSIASVVLDITDFDSSHLGANTVILTLEDPSGNRTIKTAIVTVVDVIAPIISLLGDNPLEITIGNGYTEPGATTDDGSDVSIDTSNFQDELGTYIIRYNATDASGNTAAEVTREVNVVERCPLFDLPTDNFQIEAIGETCNGKANGSIRIIANKILDYTVRISGENYTFTKDFELNDLRPGNYIVCIGLENYANCESCFELNIAEGDLVSGKTSIANKNGIAQEVTVEMESGTAPFTVKINDIEIAQYQNSNFIVNINKGDTLEVHSAVACEGKLRLQIEGNISMRAYPNPTTDSVEINIGNLTVDDTVQVAILNVSGALLSSKEVLIISGKLSVSFVELPTGVYFVRINTATPQILKIIKQ